MTLLRPAELATAVIVVWAFLDALTAPSRRERNRDLAWSAAFGLLAVGVVWVLAWSAAKARAGT